LLFFSNLNLIAVKLRQKKSLVAYCNQRLALYDFIIHEKWTTLNNDELYFKCHSALHKKSNVLFCIAKTGYVILYQGYPVKLILDTESATYDRRTPLFICTFLQFRDNKTFSCHILDKDSLRILKYIISPLYKENLVSAFFNALFSEFQIFFQLK
jgi:hypothetical protein